MGWGYGRTPQGKEVGYNIAAICEEPGCTETIDRGLAYKCGDMHGAADDYCDGYFCYAHLVLTDKGQRCARCAEPILATEEDEVTG